jgi:hypothetical protein
VVGLVGETDGSKACDVVWQTSNWCEDRKSSFLFRPLWRPRLKSKANPTRLNVPPHKYNLTRGN